MHARASKNRKQAFGLTPATLRVLQRAGYIGSRSPADYSFNELVVLRTVSALQAAKVPPRLINRALRDLAPKLDHASPINRVTWDTVSGELGVRDGRDVWEPGSGQYVLPLERIETTAQVVPIAKELQNKAQAHYLRARALEDEDLPAARAAYEACIAADCGHVDARINLGRLLHLAGLYQDAERIYSDYAEPSALLFFNFGVLLEDLRRDMEAMESYRKAILHDPGMADAHFNLSLVHERLGEPQAAFRHLLAYRRLVESPRLPSQDITPPPKV
jgi:tetratricopeptide (TPR) repeat protein